MDYDSDYFDPYAYVNDMNDDILERDELDTFYLIQHFIDYLTKIIKGEITELTTIDSLYRIIKFYYYQRIHNINQIIFYDSYAYANDLNDVMQDLDISDLSEIETESEDENASHLNEMNIESDSSAESGSESESEAEDVEIKLVDPYLSKFLDNDANNSDILLYQVNSKPIEKLEHFLNLNKFY